MGISVWKLVLVLLIVLMLFGTRRLRDIGGDLGGAIKSFRGALAGGDDEQRDEKPDSAAPIGADAACRKSGAT